MDFDFPQASKKKGQCADFMWEKAGGADVEGFAVTSGSPVEWMALKEPS